MYNVIENEIFHVHTGRCKHAGDLPDTDFIEKAIELGASRIVFTDHSPFPGNPFGNRMDYEELSEYLSTMQELKIRYQHRIEILCGLEVEYLPGFDGYIHELKTMPGMDLLILGQHFFEHRPRKYSFSDEDKSMEYEGLAAAIMLGIESGCFDVIAHPDRIFRRRKQFDKEERTVAGMLIDTVNRCNTDMKLEKNLSSMRRKYQYRPEFWDMIPSSLSVIYGYDAHSMKDMEKGWEYTQSLKAL